MMNDQTAVSTADRTEQSFGGALRQHRTARKLSQMELSLVSGTSQRHISFLESERARPSRATVIRLAESLQVPLRERNHLLLLAGFAPAYAKRALLSGDMQPIRQALDRLLHYHEPYPAIIIDRGWNLVQANEAATRTMAAFGDIEQMWAATCPDVRRNILRLLLHPLGLRRVIRNFDEVARALVTRARQEAFRTPEVAGTLDAVLSVAKLRLKEEALTSQPTSPVLLTEFVIGGYAVRTFSMFSSFGTAFDVTADELVVEHIFPADAESERFFQQLAQRTV
jgi:transcriptional regulator with XRE-family HTH domain